MTERDAIKQVVEQSITTKVDIETLRKWCKVKLEDSVRKYKDKDLGLRCYHRGQLFAYGEMIMHLDELEVNKKSDKR